jgi:hypothetical protein
MHEDSMCCPVHVEAAYITTALIAELSLFPIYHHLANTLYWISFEPATIHGGHCYFEPSGHICDNCSVKIRLNY